MKRFRNGVYFTFFVFGAAVVFFAKPKSELIENETSPILEKTKIKLAASEPSPPPPLKKDMSSQLKPQSIQFRPQQLSAAVFGSSGSGRGFAAGSGLSENLSQAKEISIGPRPGSAIQLKYPDFARQKGYKGYVELQAYIQEDGSIAEIQIIGSEPKGFFDQYVKDEIKKVRFLPALSRGVPAAQWWQQRIRFEYE